MKTRFYLITAAALVLAACGSTSGMKRADSDVAPAKTQSSGKDKAAISADFSSYSRVVVRDFANWTKIKGKDEAKRSVQEAQAIAVGKRFADKIAEGLGAGTAFESVTRNDAEVGAGTLVIQGEVTKYKAGNRALRMVIGFGAGSANFDARVSFVDGATGKEVSFMTVDKNSWFLGGLLAAAQTVDDFVDGSATKVAEETLRAKTGAK
jgi:hypothetical protein